MTSHHPDEVRRTPTPAGTLDPSIIDVLPDVIAVIDTAGRIVRANDAWTAFARANGAADAVVRGVGQDYLKECRRAARDGSVEAEAALAAIQSVLEGHTTRASMQYTCHGPDSLRWHELTVCGLVDGSGAVLVHRDISALARAEAALRLEQHSPAGSITALRRAVERLGELTRRDRALLEAIPDLVFEVGRDCRILSFRPAQDVELYAPPGEFLGRRVDEILPHPAGARIAEAVSAAFEAASIQTVSYELSGGDEVREYEARVIPADSSTAFGLVRDFTAQRREQREAERRRQVGELEGLVERQLLRRNPYGLTFRELTVLNLVASGLSDKEIAERLVLSVYTVNKHVANVLSKMSVQSRTQAAIRAQREGILLPD